jgi:hypothetical protein
MRVEKRKFPTELRQSYRLRFAHRSPVSNKIRPSPGRQHSGRQPKCSLVVKFEEDLHMRFFMIISIAVLTVLNTYSAHAAGPIVPEQSIQECLKRMPNVRSVALCLVIRLGTKTALEVAKALGIEEAVRWTINELRRLGVIKRDGTEGGGKS